VGSSLPQVNGNRQPSTKRALKDDNINADEREVRDITVTHMKPRFEETSHILPFALIGPQILMAYKEGFLSEPVSCCRDILAHIFKG
jgi:hypothetical protein